MERRYQAGYKIPMEELYVKTLRSTMDKAFADWFETAVMEGDRVVKHWATLWLEVASRNGLDKFDAESIGLRGARALRNLINIMTKRYVVVDGPFNWRYNIAEINTTVAGRTLGLVRNKRKRNDVYAYHILEVLPASHRFWPSQNAFRLLQVASRACRELLEGTPETRVASFRSGTATTLAIDPWRGTVEELQGTSNERSSLHLLDTIVDQMHARSILPHEATDKCKECPFLSTCDIKYIGPYFQQRPKMAREEIEGKLCHTQETILYDTWQTMLECIMGFCSLGQTVLKR